MAGKPGVIALFGSGETSASGRKVYDWILGRMQPPLQLAILETPAGFQPNSAIVAEKVADFLRGHLQNLRPRVEVIPARKRGTPFSPDDPAILAPLLTADGIFLGPGSPTYAAQQLKGSLAWGYAVARQRLGAALILASAATIAASAHALPVYEIYKVGADPHWQQGLDLFAPYGLSLTLVPHWDNNEGGLELDTSRCYMGQGRFQQLLAQLPRGQTVVGIDEHTALVVDAGAQSCRVMGRGGVFVLRQGQEARFTSGHSFPAAALGPFHLPGDREGIPPEAWEAATAAPARAEEPAPCGPPPPVLELVQAREAARARRDWALADELRRRISEQGWQVVDTPQGPQLGPHH